MVEAEPAPAKRLERGEVVVARVLDAVVEEIALVGFSALTLERVAARAGVNRTTIYRRWPTKGALALAAMQRVSSSINFDIDTGTMRDDLRKLIESASRSAFAPGTLGVWRVQAEAADEPEIKQFAEQTRGQKLSQALGLLTRWRDRGELRADIDPEIFVESIMGVLFLRALFRREALTDGFVDRLVDHFYAIATCEQRKSTKPLRRRRAIAKKKTQKSTRKASPKRQKR